MPEKQEQASGHLIVLLLFWTYWTLTFRVLAWGADSVWASMPVSGGWFLDSMNVQFFYELLFLCLFSLKNTKATSKNIGILCLIATTETETNKKINTWLCRLTTSVRPDSWASFLVERFGLELSNVNSGLNLFKSQVKYNRKWKHIHNFGNA